jgi:hypothetical protein
LVVGGAFCGSGLSGRSVPKPGGVADVAADFEAFGFFGSRPLRF